MLCWCRSEVDKKGHHLTIPEGNAPWSDSQFVLRDGYVTHIKGKPEHQRPVPPTTARGTGPSDSVAGSSVSVDDLGGDSTPR